MFTHAETESNVKSTPPKLPRSSTLPQSFATDNTTSNTPNESKTLDSSMTSPWANKLSTGYSSLKFAANRLNEFKSSFTNPAATNSPSKLNMANVVASSSNYLISQIKNFAFDDEDPINAPTLDTLDINSDDEGYEVLDSYSDLFHTLSEHYSSSIDAANLATSEIVFCVQMMSCTICRGCSSVVYDEEIMCQLGAEDSNLNTKCIHCHCTFVPSLTIYIQVHDCPLWGFSLLTWFPSPFIFISGLP